MKHLDYNQTTGKIIGFYESEINSSIPPNTLVVSEEVWMDCAQHTDYRKVDVITKSILKLPIPNVSPSINWELFFDTLILNSTYIRLIQWTSDQRSVARLENILINSLSKLKFIEKFWNQIIAGLPLSQPKITAKEIEILQTLAVTCNMPFRFSATATIILL